MKKETENKSRRAFLKGAGVAATAVGAGAVSSTALAEKMTEESKPILKDGYRETDHIREYYRLARF